MKIYLNPNVESIPIFSKLKLILEEYLLTHKDFPLPKDILAASRLLDPVRNYIQYHILEAGISVDEGRLDYIVNCLYKTKGSPKVIDTLSEVLDTHITYSYEFPTLIGLNFDHLTISNLAMYKRKLTLALEYLLYCEDLKIHIDKLTLLLTGNLEQVISFSCTPFQLHGEASKMATNNDIA